VRAVRKVVEQHEFYVNRRTDIHTLLKGVNGFIPTLSVFLDGCGLNSVQEIPHSATGGFEFGEKSMERKPTLRKGVDEIFPYFVPTGRLETGVK